jgi:hypothetical protein
MKKIVKELTQERIAIADITEDDIVVMRIEDTPYMSVKIPNDGGFMFKNLTNGHSRWGTSSTLKGLILDHAGREVYKLESVDELGHFILDSNG